MILKRRLSSDASLILTPLIDMIFLVVIFFMINATFSINPAIRVDLPQAHSSESSLEKQIVVTVKSDQSIHIDGTEVALDRFVATLKEESAARAVDSILLQGDRGLPYGKIIEVMDLARTSGIARVLLVAAKKSLPR